MSAKSLLNIVHRDPDFVVVDKPSGMLSIPGKGPEKADSVTARLKSMYPDCMEHPAVHRLDMDTSGLMVLGLNTAAQRHLSIQFQRRKTSKRYVALLDGHLDRDHGTIKLPFRVDVDNRPMQIYDQVNGKMGITHWKKIGPEDGWTRVSFIPITGRTHQLRVHSAHEKGLGVPIVGDPLYGNGTGPAQLKLHACELGFHHPATNEELKFESKPLF